MHNRLSDITSREMDRKEFLKHAGIGMVLLFGGGFLIRMLGVSYDNYSSKNQGDYYGIGAYGGRR